MAEFVLLKDLVQGVQLSDGEDKITWKLTPDVQYTTKSAYEFQFRGSFSSFIPYQNGFGQCMPSPSTGYSLGFLYEKKILTTDKLHDRYLPCNPFCLLCGFDPEIAQHLCLQCPYAQRIWELVQAWTYDLVALLLGFF